MGESGESEVKKVMIRDMNLQQIKELIDKTLNNIMHTQHKLVADENKHEQQKHFYQIALLEKKYSEEYEKFSSLKMKQEKAEIEFAEQKGELIKSQKNINWLKKELEHNQLLLKYLFRLYDEVKWE